MPAIARRTSQMAATFVDRLNGLFGYQTGRPAGGGRSLPSQLGNQIALMFSFGNELMKRLKIEMDRLTTLDDVNRMLEEDVFVAGNLDKFIALVTNYEPTITFQGVRSAEAARVTDGLLMDRLDYASLRGDWIWRLISWGDLFLQRELIVDPAIDSDLTKDADKLAMEIAKGRPIGFVAGVLDLPAHSMFRNSNSQDRFSSPRAAFTQVPEGAARFSQPQNAPGALDFPLYSIDHARWGRGRQRDPRYGRSALKSLRAQYNKLEVSKFDLLIARHTQSTQKLVFYLNHNVAEGNAPGAEITPEQLQDFYDTVLKPKRGEYTELGPDTNFVLPGQHHVEAVGTAGQFSMSVPEDLYLGLEIEMQGFFCHPRLFGYQHGSAVSGDALKVMLWMADQFGDEIRRQEWRQILRPLVQWNLWMNGIFTATPSVDWVPRRPPITLAEAEAKGRSEPSPEAGTGNGNRGGT